MSAQAPALRSTGRGGRRRHGSPDCVQLDMELGDAGGTDGEHYKTPAWLADMMLDHLPAQPRGEFAFLDAGAGLGPIAARVAERYPACTVTAVELVPGRSAKWPAWWRRWTGDLFAFVQDAERRGVRFDLIATNPPFSVWFDWTEACRRLLYHQDDGAVLASLSPAEYINRNADWWNRCLPALHVTTDRRAWRDVREVAWSYWVGSQGHDSTRLVRVPAAATRHGAARR